MLSARVSSGFCAMHREGADGGGVDFGEAVIASEAKQSIVSARGKMNCFAASFLAITKEGLRHPLLQQILQIEAMREHRERSVRCPRPLFFRPVPIKLDAVLVGIAQVKRLADAVVAGAVKRNAGADHAMERIRQRGPARIEDGGVIEPRRSRRRRTAAFALPGVQADVVMIAAGRNEGRLQTPALHQFEAEHAAIKSERALEVGDLEMNMPDAGAGDDGRGAFGHESLRVFLPLPVKNTVKNGERIGNHTSSDTSAAGSSNSNVFSVIETIV